MDKSKAIISEAEMYLGGGKIQEYEKMFKIKYTGIKVIKTIYL